MANDEIKLVSELRKGDLVMSKLGKAAKIVCVVKTDCSMEKIVDVVKFEGGLVITPYHPIFLKGNWAFPIDAGKVSKQNIPAVYSFVLD